MQSCLTRLSYHEYSCDTQRSYTHTLHTHAHTDTHTHTHTHVLHTVFLDVCLSLSAGSHS